jgi:hypothetical protein
LATEIGSSVKNQDVFFQLREPDNKFSSLFLQDIDFRPTPGVCGLIEHKGRLHETRASMQTLAAASRPPAFVGPGKTGLVRTASLVY